MAIRGLTRMNSMAAIETTTTPKSVRCVVVTPEKAVLDAVVDFVAVPM